MAATITRLQSKPERLQAEQAEQLRQLLLEFPDLPERERSKLVAAIDKLVPASSAWTFVMISPVQNAAVVSWLRTNSHAPLVAVTVWSVLFTDMRWDSGEITLTRDQIAEQAVTQPDTVSRVMGELESIGAISRRREKIPGMRGPGVARYFMNPNVGTNLSGAARDRAQATAPKLKLVKA